MHWLETANTRQSKQCGFCIYIFDQSKSMVRLVRAEKMVLTGLVFARKIARMILIHYIYDLMGPLMINMTFMHSYMWKMWDVTPVTDTRTDEQWKVVQYSVWAESAIVQVDQKQVEVTELFMRAVSKMMMGGEWRPPNCTNRPSRPLWRKLWRRWGRLVRRMFSEHGIISGSALH